jgi:hypothetical protein
MVLLSLGFRRRGGFFFLPQYRTQYAIDKFRAVVAAKGFGQFDSFVYDNFRRDAFLVPQLIQAHSEYNPVHPGYLVYWPFRRYGLQRDIEFLLFRGDAMYQLPYKVQIIYGLFVAADIAFQHIIKVNAGIRAFTAEVILIQGLQRYDAAKVTI